MIIVLYNAMDIDYMNLGESGKDYLEKRSLKEFLNCFSIWEKLLIST